MTRILFVHGTGVREKAFEDVFSKLRDGLNRIRPKYGVDPCLWGETEGASLLAQGQSIPRLTSSGRESPADNIDEKAVSPGADDVVAATWMALELNPVVELVELTESSGRIRFDSQPSADSVATALEGAVKSNPRVVAALANAGLEEIASPSLEILFATPECQQALSIATISVVDLIAPLARAFVAICLKELDAQLESEASIDGLHRDQVVLAIVDALGGDSRGFGTRIVGSTARLILNLGLLSPIEKNRALLAPKAVPAMGDVLKYLVRGDGLRNHLRASISETNEDVVVLAHSLGGIAAVDLLVTESFEQVVGLVTVGTQVGMLYELDALPSLKFGKQLPKSFPRWDNVVDPRDLLAYSAQGVFPASSADHYINNRVPFPRNHSAYFGNAEFYSILDDVLP